MKRNITTVTPITKVDYPEIFFLDMDKFYLTNWIDIYLNGICAANRKYLKIEHTNRNYFQDNTTTCFDITTGKYRICGRD